MHPIKTLAAFTHKPTEVWCEPAQVFIQGFQMKASLAELMNLYLELQLKRRSFWGRFTFTKEDEYTLSSVKHAFGLINLMWTEVF